MEERDKRKMWNKAIPMLGETNIIVANRHSVTDPGLHRGAAADECKHDRENESDDKQNPGDIGSGAGNTGKAEYAGDNCDYQKSNSPSNHGFSPS
jgi:hypothetical protein